MNFNSLKLVTDIKSKDINIDTLQSIEISSLQEQVLIGCFLGDGHLRKVGNSIHFSVTHSEKQKDYILWKYDILQSLCSKEPVYIERKPDKRTGKCYNEFQLITKANSEFHKYYDLLYINGKKQITKELLTYYTPISLAIHYCDDGTMNYRNPLIETQSFSEESVNNFREWLLQYDIETTVRKPGIVCIRTKSYKNFIDCLPNNFLPEMFSYKFIQNH